MYRAFYSLAGRPFTKEIKAADMFPSSSHQECHARLGYLRDNRGIGLLVGEPGSGKTAALRAFVSSLNPALYNPIYFPLSTVTVRDFYRGLALSLNLEPASRRIDVFHQIQGAVLSGYQGKKVTPFIVLDEMHLATSFRTSICSSTTQWTQRIRSRSFFADCLNLAPNSPSFTTSR